MSKMHSCKEAVKIYNLYIIHSYSYRACVDSMCECAWGSCNMYYIYFEGYQSLIINGQLIMEEGNHTSYYSTPFRYTFT